MTVCSIRFSNHTKKMLSTKVNREKTVVLTIGLSGRLVTCVQPAQVSEVYSKVRSSLPNINSLHSYRQEVFTCSVPFLLPNQLHQSAEQIIEEWDSLPNARHSPTLQSHHDNPSIGKSILQTWWAFPNSQQPMHNAINVPLIITANGMLANASQLLIKHNTHSYYTDTKWNCLQSTKGQQSSEHSR